MSWVVTWRRGWPALMWGPGLLAVGVGLSLLPLRFLVVAVIAATVASLSVVHPAVALYLLCFAIPFGSLAQVEVGGIRVGVTEGLLALTLMGWMAREVAVRAPRWTWPRLSVPLLTFVGVAACSLVMAESLPLALKELVKWIEFLGVMLLIVNALSYGEVMTVVICILLAGIAQALLGAHQFLTRSGPEFFVLMGRFMRAYGTFEQPNPYAGYLGMIVPLAVALVISIARGHLRPGIEGNIVLVRPEVPATGESPAGQDESSRNRSRCPCLPGTFVIALIGAAVMLAAIGMSWSRGAWMGVSGALLVIIPARGRRWAITFATLAAAAALTFVLGLWSLPPALRQRLSGLASFWHIRDVRQVEVRDENYAAVERMAHWQAALAMWRDHLWLGVGLGNYGIAYAAYALPKWPLPLGHAHNYYLNIAAETGLPGLIAYLGMWGAALAQTTSALYRTRDRYSRALALGALGMLIYVSIHNLVDNLWVHNLYLQAAILLGLVDRLTNSPPQLS